MSYFPPQIIFVICAMLSWWQLNAADPTANPPKQAALPAIPAAQQAELQAAGTAFMRQFSISESSDEYQLAFEGLFSRYTADQQSARSKAREMASSVSAGQSSLKDELGPPLQGDFVYVGSRRIGARLLKLTYLRKHALGPMPLVMLFERPDQDWRVSNMAFGAGSAGADLNALWVHETPDLISQAIPDFAKLRAASDDCMKALVQGDIRSGVEKLIQQFSAGAPNSSLLVDGLVNSLEGRPDMGKSKGYELLGTARQANVLCKLVYVWQLEKAHAPLCLEFYHARDNWVLWQVRIFDNAVPDLMKCTVSEPAR